MCWQKTHDLKHPSKRLGLKSSKRVRGKRSLGPTSGPGQLMPSIDYAQPHLPVGGHDFFSVVAGGKLEIKMEQEYI
jgi:hypothetical protein